MSARQTPKPASPRPASAKPATPAAAAPATELVDAPKAPAKRPSSRRKISIGPATSSRLWVRHALMAGVVMSLAAHAFVLSLSFRAPEGSVKKAEDKGLKVVLVNARHKLAPRDAQALAQANLDGGGDQSDQKHMTSSPLPPQDSVRDGDALVERSQRVRDLEARQRELLAVAQGSKNKVAAERQTQSAEKPVDAPAERGLDINSARAIARQEAIVERMVSDYAARPRKGIASPRTREYKLALYAEAWRAKVQRIGELNFPRDAKGALYGSAQVSVEIKPDGTLAALDITRPSSNPKINEAALNIIRRSAPFARIPDEVRKDYDIIVIVRTMNFTREEIGLEN